MPRSKARGILILTRHKVPAPSRLRQRQINLLPVGEVPRYYSAQPRDYLTPHHQ